MYEYINMCICVCVYLYTYISIHLYLTRKNILQYNKENRRTARNRALQWGLTYKPDNQPNGGSAKPKLTGLYNR